MSPKHKHKQNINRKRNPSKQKIDTIDYRPNHSGPEGLSAPDHELFPAKAIWLVHLTTLFTRVVIAADKGNWWILHPDEVFQTVEIAHSEVYGYGFRPYEYLAQPDINTTHIPDQQRTALGMFSLRSFFLPRIFVALFSLKELLGLQSNPFLMARVFHAIVGAHLPLAVFYFLRHLVESRDQKVMASIMVATSEHLTILGTHTLVNSFMAPFVFFALGWFFDLTNTTVKNQVRCTKVRNKLSKHNQLSNGVHGFLSNGFTAIRRDLSVNGNGQVNWGSIETETEKTNEYNNNQDTQCSNGKCQQTPTGVNLSDHLNFACTGSSLLRWCRYEKLTCLLKKIPNLSSSVHRIGCGTLFGILVYTRVDLVLFFCSVIIAFYISNALSDLKTMTRDLFPFALGGCVGLVLGGWDDYTSYGVWFISPYQWFIFNVYRDFATSMFGQRDQAYYSQEVFLQDGYSIILCILIISALVTPSIIQKNVSNRAQTTRPLVRFMLVCFMLTMFYSTKGHKEVRFVHNMIVIYRIVCAIAIGVMISCLGHLFQSVKVRDFLYTMVVLASLCSIFTRCTRLSEKEIAKWSHQGSSDSGHVNNCLNFIGERHDVTGVFLDKSVHMTGGYSVLHTDVPILALVHFEYYEFGKSARQSVISSSRFGIHAPHTIAVSVFSQISNYFTAENRPLLVKHLFEHTEYNYAVVSADKIIVDTGFEKVFSSGFLQVMKRRKNQENPMHLQNLANKIPIGTNATVLEFEGSWLYTFGLYNKSVERLEEALKLERDRIKVYQLLSTSYEELGKEKAAKQVFEQCVSLHGQECYKTQQRVVLHSALNIEADG